MTLPIADAWFDSIPLDDGVTLIGEPHVDPVLRCNIWHVRGGDRDLLVDTGLGVAGLRGAIGDLLARPVVVVATHSHFDHIGSLHQFDTRLVHRLEAGLLAAPEIASLSPEGMGEEFCRFMAEAGHPPDQPMIDALPFAGYDPAGYSVAPAPATGLIDEGDVIDLGGRWFRAIHLPGHSPGSIGLWEAETGILFSGDAIYDGPLYDFLPDSDIGDYVRTMERLRSLPVRVVHGGHDPSFGRARMIEIIDAYLRLHPDRGGEAKGKT